DEILKHFLVFTDDGRLQLHAPHLVLAGHDDFHHAAARHAFDFESGDLSLGLLHDGLHRLSLLHQVSDVVFHGPKSPTAVSTDAPCRAPAWRRTARATREHPDRTQARVSLLRSPPASCADRLAPEFPFPRRQSLRTPAAPARRNIATTPAPASLPAAECA